MVRVSDCGVLGRRLATFYIAIPAPVTRFQQHVVHKLRCDTQIGPRISEIRPDLVSTVRVKVDIGSR
jgi:hypothetical protein